VLNGKSLGKGTPCSDEFPEIENPPLVWKNIAYKKGTLEARGKFKGQEKTDSRSTEGMPAKILLAASNELIADGRDISYIDLTICDTKGNRCYTTNCSLSVIVSGSARLGGPIGIDAVAGLARVAIRSTGEPGDVYVLATGKNLKSGELKLIAK
jgi:beta-galactosidase